MDQSLENSLGIVVKPLLCATQSGTGLRTGFRLSGWFDNGAAYLQNQRNQGFVFGVSGRGPLRTEVELGAAKGTLRLEIAAIAVPATIDGHNMTDEDFAVTTGWGHLGTSDAVMPGQGYTVERTWTPEKWVAMGDALPVLGDTALDVYLNARTFWCNVPEVVRRY